MVIALGATVPLLHFTTVGAVIVAIGIVIGVAIGTVGARIVHMTAIPQMVALFNGVGGGAAALVAVAELLHFGVHPPLPGVLPPLLTLRARSLPFPASLVPLPTLHDPTT